MEAQAPRHHSSSGTLGRPCPRTSTSCARSARTGHAETSARPIGPPRTSCGCILMGPSPDVADYWESMWVEADQFVDAGDAVVVLGRVYGRGKKSGVAIKAPAAWVCRQRDARLSYLRFYFDHSSALKAVGLEG